MSDSPTQIPSSSEFELLTLKNGEKIEPHLNEAIIMEKLESNRSMG